MQTITQVPASLLLKRGWKPGTLSRNGNPIVGLRADSFKSYGETLCIRYKDGSFSPMQTMDTLITVVEED